MYLGIDVGTSGVKAILLDDKDKVLDQQTIPLDISRPKLLWSEQNPEDWWQATVAAIDAIKSRNPAAIAKVQSIGLAGQMHGATLLDKNDKVLRPAILWNDGRSGAECIKLERRAPGLRKITGNLAMPGFTAPKLLWVAEHEPKIFEQVAKVLLPKDYVRFRMAGIYASDMSDSSGTSWMDVGKRDWSDEMLAATGLTKKHMPDLVEGTDAAGTLRKDLAQQWGMTDTVILAGGAGDNASGAAGIGVVTPGRAFISLGTSGVYFASTKNYSPNADKTVHTFCHCIPNTWHQMAVILSAASCLSWATNALAGGNQEELLAEVATADLRKSTNTPHFLPYLSGERSPHNDPNAKGVFFGINHNTSRLDMTLAVLEGVAFAFADGQDSLLESGTVIDTVSVIGGGSRTKLWGKILASVLNRPLTYHEGGDLGPAFGAARLARLAKTKENPQQVCYAPPVKEVVEPDLTLYAQYMEKLRVYRKLYVALKPTFAEAA